MPVRSALFYFVGKASVAWEGHESDMKATCFGHPRSKVDERKVKSRGKEEWEGYGRDMPWTSPGKGG